MNAPFDSPKGSDTYLFLRSDDSDLAKAYRRRIVAWHERYESLLDLDFCSKFACQPENRYWELVVADLIENRSDLGLYWSRVRTKNAETPDFKADYAGRCIWIEATTTGRGTGRDWVPPLVPDDGQEHLGGSERRQLVFRVQNRLSAKAKRLRKLNDAGINFIAIGGGEVPTAQWHNNIGSWRDIAALFYPVAPLALINLDGSPVAPKQELNLLKSNSGPVPKGFGARDIAPAHVAGVLFSTHTIAGLSSEMNPSVYWIENPYCPDAELLRPAFAQLHRIIVEKAHRRVEYLPQGN